MITTLEVPQTRNADEGHGSGLNHYVKKDMITCSIVKGVKVTALCGTRYVVNAQGAGKASRSDYAVCGDCQRRYDALASKSIKPAEDKTARG